MNNRIFNIRNKIIFAIFCCVLAVFAVCLIKVQLIDGDYYAKEAEMVKGSVVKVQAARGEILDRNGVPLVGNRQGYAVNFIYASFPSEKKQDERNALVYKMINMFEKHDQEWIDTLPIEIKNGVPVFKEDSDSSISFLKGNDFLDMNEYATAQNCMTVLIKKYALEKYSLEDARNIASVYYNMKRMLFGTGAPYTFAEDVTDEIVALIEENYEKYEGVEVETALYREYNDGTLAPHILGTVGAIDAEEYKTLKDKGYSITSDIGKSGIENVMESYLKGTDGYKTVYRDSNGNLVSEITTKPIQGNSVVLTIDSGLQKVAAEALEEEIFEMKTDTSPAGAVVVVEVDTGEVLASVTYPTYDISTYTDDYEDLIKAPNAPLWNRALLSTYAPGSTAKPSVAIAALEESEINQNTTFFCDTTFEYGDHVFRCNQTHASRYVNVIEAINESCNTFFYQMANVLGIDKMNQYRTLLGLGEKTGVELPEAEGVLDSPAYRESIEQSWQNGFTIQSGIGQAGNLFSPIQLANYCATIANGGTRYELHLVKNVKNAELTETVYTKTPKIACETGFKSETLDIVKQGMNKVGSTGYCSFAFRNLPVPAAAKTGTSQVIRTRGNGESFVGNNGFLISYAPADNPQIALCVAVEGASSGTSVAPIAARIYEYYFGENDNSTEIQSEGTLIV